MGESQLTKLLEDYHARLLGRLTRRKRATDTWRTDHLVQVLNDEFQILLLEIIDMERRSNGPR
jgi:hypothetical protein